MTCTQRNQHGHEDASVAKQVSKERKQILFLTYLLLPHLTSHTTRQLKFRHMLLLESYGAHTSVADMSLDECTKCRDAGVVSEYTRRHRGSGTDSLWTVLAGVCDSAREWSIRTPIISQI